MIIVNWIAAIAMLTCVGSCKNQADNDSVPIVPAMQQVPHADTPGLKESTALQPLATTPPPMVLPGGVSGNVNPPHGQPGHRCDIAVGAPLPAGNTVSAAQVQALPPAQAAAVEAQAMPASSPLPPPPPKPTAPVTARAGMNPPHGQPGHRCDIAVGAPLNSAPPASQTARPAATTPAAVPLQQPQQVPAAPPQSKTDSGSTTKVLNPPHGQPGHRCDIAVGAPLQ